MPLVEVIGWIAALSSASLAIPQGVRIATTRSVAGISTLTWQTTMVAGFAWCGHGLITARHQIIWPNLLLGITSALVLWQLTTARKLPVLRTWAPPLFAAAAAIGVDLLAGPVAYGAVIVIPAIVGQTSQFRQIVRSPDTTGVSMVGLLMQLANQILWLSYGFPTGERAVIVVAIPIGILVTGSIIALSLRRRRAAAVPDPALA